MKVTHHVPVEDFGFIEFYVDNIEEIPIEKISSLVTQYRALSRAGKGAIGMDNKAFDTFVQNFLEGKDNQIEDMEKLNDTQEWVYQVLKRARSRINYKIRNTEQNENN